MLMPEELMPDFELAICDDSAGSTQINSVDGLLMIERK